MVRTTLLVLSAVSFVLFATTATLVVTAQRQGYGIELRTIAFALGFLVVALISTGCWLFLKAK